MGTREPRSRLFMLRRMSKHCVVVLFTFFLSSLFSWSDPGDYGTCFSEIRSIGAHLGAGVQFFAETRIACAFQNYTADLIPAVCVIEPCLFSMAILSLRGTKQGTVGYYSQKTRKFSQSSARLSSSRIGRTGETNMKKRQIIE